GVAIEWQRGVAALPADAVFNDWASFLSENDLEAEPGTLSVREHDFTEPPPGGQFDVVINRRAFQGLSPDPMADAARHYASALRPGGAAIIDTINVQGRRRDAIE